MIAELSNATIMNAQKTRKREYLMICIVYMYMLLHFLMLLN